MTEEEEEEEEDEFDTIFVVCCAFKAAGSVLNAIVEGTPEWCLNAKGMLSSG